MKFTIFAHRSNSIVMQTSFLPFEAICELLNTLEMEFELNVLNSELFNSAIHYDEESFVESLVFGQNNLFSVLLPNGETSTNGILYTMPFPPHEFRMSMN